MRVELPVSDELPTASPFLPLPPSSVRPAPPASEAPPSPSAPSSTPRRPPREVVAAFSPPFSPPTPELGSLPGTYSSLSYSASSLSSSSHASRSDEKGATYLGPKFSSGSMSRRTIDMVFPFLILGDGAAFPSGGRRRR